MIVTEMTGSFIDQEVLSYDHLIIDVKYIFKIWSNRQISSTSKEEDVVLEPCILDERVCITWPTELLGDCCYFYFGVIEDFNICIPFTDFESDLLKILNTASSLLHLNGWGFIKAFEVVYEVVDIIPTLGLVFFFFELKGPTREDEFPLTVSKEKGSSKLIQPTIKYLR